jgi:hypothetical protein
MRKKNRKRRSALTAAERGWPAFPLYSAKNGACSCGDPLCEDIGKHPITRHGFYDATTNIKQIKDWWAERPDANVAVATGKPSGLFVLDVDPDKGGFETLRKLEAEHGPLPQGPILKTGGGGRHHYFDYADSDLPSTTNLLPGLDTRGRGGYVVYAESVHESGKLYRFLRDKTPRKIALPPVPDYLAELVRRSRSSRIQDSKSQEFKNITEGSRNDSLASVAGSLRHWGLNLESIETVLTNVNGLICNPPLSDREVTRIARSISGYSSALKIHSAHLDKVKGAEKKLVFFNGKEIDTNLEPVEWIAEPWIAKGAITELDGKVKKGKTTFLFFLLGRVFDGSAFLGESTKQVNAVYLTEQNRTSYRASLERAGLLGRPELTTLFWSDALGVSWTSIIKQAVDECNCRGAKLLIVDTLAQFAQLAGDSENHAGRALEALSPLQEAAAQGLAVVVVRHERKSGGALGDSGRGSSAFAGGVDIVISLREPDGNYPQNVRLLQSVSRFDSSDDLLIELTDHGYRAIGTPGEGVKQQRDQDLLATLPQSSEDAITMIELVKQTGQPRGRLQRTLTRLLEGKSAHAIGKGTKHHAVRYFRS